ncbi:MAG: formylglycine-generating enzyme family protein [Phycisphaerales bacterium]|nr:MAG: formylglycine-generating enzyme family protein [Phycisphaerales bacterium]
MMVIRSAQIAACGVACAPILFLSSCATTSHVATQNSSISSNVTSGPDMVFIPAGEFVMGKDGEEDHSPAHTVRLNAFYIDACEVTNSQYFEFCEATDHPLPMFWGMDDFHCGPEFPQNPVVGVSWRDATAYCEWAGKRLPTEAEWEYAARGGVVGMEYPHGNELTPADANYWRWDAIELVDGSHRVGGHAPNGYGLYDMAGNVAEWVQDYYDREYYIASPAENPQGPEKGRFRVFRGGGWHSGPTCNRVYYRNALPHNWLDFNVGFRCARDAD